MVHIRAHKQMHLTRHTVAMLLVCAPLPADTITTTALLMIVAGKKEAAP